MKKFNLLLISTYNVGLRVWKEHGLYSREIAYYKKLGQYLNKFGIVSYDKVNEKPEDGEYFYYFNRFSVNSFLYSILIFFLFRREIKNFDVIRTNQFAGAWAALLIKIFNRKKIFVLRGGHAWDYEGGSKVARFISDFVMNLCLRYADLIFFVSMEDREKYLKRISKKQLEKVKILPNSVDINLFSPKVELNKNCVRILMLGRLVEMKNFQSVISAISSLDNSVKEGLEINIIGDGEYSDSLKKLVKEKNLKVNFLGSIPNNKTADYLAISDIFVLPQVYGSGMSKVLLEAMATGNVVIASDLPAHKNTIDENINGFICGVDVLSIKEKLEYVIKNINTDEIKKVRESAVRKIHDNFSMDVITKKEYNYICEIYEKNI